MFALMYLQSKIQGTKSVTSAQELWPSDGGGHEGGNAAGVKPSCLRAVARGLPFLRTYVN